MYYQIALLILTAAEKGPAYVRSLIDTWTRDGQMTEAEAGELHKKAEALFASDAAKTDDQLSGG